MRSLDPHGPRAIALIVCTATLRSRQIASERARSRPRTPASCMRDVAVREQHRVEREPLEAAQVHRGDREPVAGDADEPDEPLVARLDARPAAHRRGPSASSHSSGWTRQWSWMRSTWSTPSRSSERRICSRAARVRALAGLRREEEPVAVLAQPGREPQLGVAVARGGVDVVDRRARAAARARRSASPWVALPSAAAPKMHARALVARRAERDPLDHCYSVRRSGR